MSLCCALLLSVLMHFQALAAGTVTLVWNPSANPLVVGYNIYYGGASGTYTNEISIGNATNVTISGLIPGTAYYFVATTYTTIDLESPFSGEVSYLVPLIVPAVNQRPTLNAITNLVINENAGRQIVSLSGITSGGTNENQTLTVAAVSSNTRLIPNPTVNYASANITGSLNFTPVSNATGTATITVTVNDGGTSNNIVTRTFTVTVNPSPTLDPISNLVVNVGASLKTINLTGISSGTTNKNVKLWVTVASSNQRLASRPTVQYISPRTNGTLTFLPGYSTGTATLSVTVNNGAKSNNIVTRTFTVTLVPRTASTSTSLAGSTRTAIPAATLTSVAGADNRFALGVAGISGHQYVVEASTDLVNWVPVYTNNAPFTFTDPDAGKFLQRFYRSVYAP
jgi:hypothetical protein